MEQNTQKPPIKLLTAINEVRRATGAVAKNGVNTFHKYSYVMAADVLEAVRAALTEQGIIIFPASIKDHQILKEGSVAEATIVYQVCHAPSGESLLMEIRGSGEDKGDKKAYKLQTGALKYLFIQLLQLPTFDDAEGHSADQGQQPKPAASQQPAATEKPWLNKPTEKAPSPDWEKVTVALKEGKCDVKYVAGKFKLSKEIKAELDAIAAAALPNREKYLQQQEEKKKTKAQQPAEGGSK